MKRLMFLATAAAAIAVTGAAYAQSANGTWVRPSTGGEIQVFNCKGGLGMKVTKSSDAGKVGKTIMCGAKSTAANRWEGSILNLDDGQTYNGVVILSGNELELSGCVLGNIICKTDKWNRK